VYPSQKLPALASCAHLDLAAIKAELVRTERNVSAAATAFCVPSADLRKFVWSTASLTDAIFEELEQMVDAAEQARRDGLKDTDKARRLQAAVTLLTQSEAGRRRGWGRRRALPDEAAEGQAVTLAKLGEGRARVAVARENRRRMPPKPLGVMSPIQIKPRKGCVHLCNITDATCYADMLARRDVAATKELASIFLANIASSLCG
jgi:hypothetical protein